MIIYREETLLIPKESPEQKAVDVRAEMEKILDIKVDSIFEVPDSYDPGAKTMWKVAVKRRLTP